MNALRAAFWLLAGTVVYAYLGYGAVISGLARCFPRPVRRDDQLRRVTLLVAAYNEESVIEQKIQNSLDLDYPKDRLQILVVTDGSSDSTPEIVRRWADRGVELLHADPRRGKPAAVARALSAATGEVVVFSDANAFLNRDALRYLVAPFADPSVGCVAGEKRVLGEDGQPSAEGLYWRYEAYLKEQDSHFHSVVGAAGELYAVRREALEPPPHDAIIDDFVVSMRIAERGYRVIYEPRAHVSELESISRRDDFERRARIACGGIQSIVWLRRLLLPSFGRLWFCYVSHRVLRWAVVPPALPVLVLLNVALARGPFYRALLGLQGLVYALGVVGLLLMAAGRSARLLMVPGYFVLTNLAALAGLYRYATRTQAITWVRAPRRPAGRS